MRKAALMMLELSLRQQEVAAGANNFVIMLNIKQMLNQKSYYGEN